MQKNTARAALDPSYRPRLATGIEAVTVDDLGHVLRNPTGRFLRLSETGRTCLALLDGEHSVEQLKRQLEQATGRPVALATVSKFVASLGRHGMLTDAPRSFGPSSVRARLRRGFGDLMNIRLGLLPGERLLQAVAAALGAIPSSLRRGLGALLLLNGLLAPAFVLVLRGPEVLALGPVPGRHLLVLAGLLALEVVLHELAHGVALTMCGGRVKEFGVGLQYLIRPYSYTNTTDGYRLSRRARLVVSLAGPAVELVLLGLSAQLLWMVPPGSAAAQILPLLMATEVSLLLFNVNPLLPVDGYYVLADLLKEPALRAESLSYWLSIPARLTGHERRAYSTRQHLTYVGYGILSTVYLVAVLGATLLTIWIVVDPLAKPRLLAAVPALRPWWP